MINDFKAIFYCLHGFYNLTVKIIRWYMDSNCHTVIVITIHVFCKSILFCFTLCSPPTCKEITIHGVISFYHCFRLVLV